MHPADLGQDPLQSADVSPISNDELLSQLAGKEIERLLAEVDDQLDEALGIIREQTPAPALALRKYPEPQHVSEQEAGLAEVLENIHTHAPQDLGEEHEIEPLERDEIQMLGTPVELFERVTGVEARPAQRVDLFPEDHEPTPVVLKPLEWVNAPFEGISHSALGAIGKVAIVSFVSAVASLVYVIIAIR
ncbi:MAG TPA: hypothetical protein VF669_15560 [Tepidisphaeraceae bacterium]|jgi:hypothetical protein